MRFIQNLYAAGLGSKAVLRILPCMEHGVLTDEMHERLLAERARVQAQLDELTATRDKLDAVIRAGQVHRDRREGRRAPGTQGAARPPPEEGAAGSPSDAVGRAPRGRPGAGGRHIASPVAGRS
ncbi:hypothetical protein [Cellulomonas sp. JZ18]|uniref:hypothetical protein n=1 Tax=Cellulomonas sp. JZ18 TaxID=2654191 RepID=UPI001E4D3802|nr:hypothetical protein [Cellulomonas sp. JZ18]